ncbi:hypothetical protein HOK68_04815 [Candidatus Woesearchaeota archaeon]|nr:hypothetical protein [Candidatus Woesearchaeota archaeon]MBT4387239.1 hypothetical protein [Candidatus Woesearchaeota archaeon]MBT4596240.1 hypothetical protein [Candidatus Woesearchaeota archaeon]MBT5741537.1 hypothetical protein [Candidatus Woesearchaeota archaeon]MBT6506069.1 hypothetical protein [Candidatus Woesearchaeota archaeon]
MRTKKTLIFALLLIVCLGLVNAIQYNFEVRDQITNDLIQDEIKVLTFECLNSDCSQTIQHNIVKHFFTGQVEYKFPITPLGNKKFKLKILNKNYLPENLDITIRNDVDLGLDISIDRKNGPVLLKNALNCYAPVIRLDEINSLGKGAPLIIKYQTNIQSDIGSPFEFTKKLSDAELQSNDYLEYLKSKVDLTLQINRNGQEVKEFETVLEMIPDEISEFEFAYTPQTAGIYTFEMQSHIENSGICLSTSQSNHESTVSIEENAPEENSCSSRIHNLQFTRPVIGADNTVIVSGEVYSRKSTGDNLETNFVPVPTQVTLTTPGSNNPLIVNLDENENNLLQTITFPNSLNDIEIYNLEVVAEPNDVSCIRKTSQTKSLDVKRDISLVSTTNGLIFKSIPDAIISITNPNYIVDLTERTVDFEGDIVTYKATATGFNYEKFELKLENNNLIISLKNSNDYFDSYLTNVQVTANDGTNKVTRTFRVRTPSARGDTVAIAKFPNKIYEGVPAIFDASETITRTGIQITEYEWDFGDNTPIQRGRTVVHTYEDSGFKILKLTVRDSARNIDIAQYPINILDSFENVDIEPMDFEVNKFIFRNQEVKPGNKISTILSFTNDAEKDLDNIRIVLIIKELGLHKTIGPISIDNKETWTRQVDLDVPKNTMPGEYYASLIISNGEFSRHKYNFVRLLEN